LSKSPDQDSIDFLWNSQGCGWAALGAVIIGWAQAEMVDFPCPNRRNKGLKLLAAHELLTMESGFQAI
jgi:hypothetical protein